MEDKISFIKNSNTILNICNERDFKDTFINITKSKNINNEERIIKIFESNNYNYLFNANSKIKFEFSINRFEILIKCLNNLYVNVQSIYREKNLHINKICDYYLNKNEKSRVLLISLFDKRNNIKEIERRICYKFNKSHLLYIFYKGLLKLNNFYIISYKNFNNSKYGKFSRYPLKKN